MSATIFSWARRSAPRDWTNDDLAELYRVEHALLQAGIAVETDRGSSDEGDPWFVFCHADGHVVVHIARIGGLYHLYCATLSEPLIGPNFAAITKAFLGAIPSPPRSGAGGRVVAHPSALLSLLVAAAIFSADALLRHSAHAAELPASPHGHLPLSNLAPSDVKKSEVLKQFTDTVAAAVWRGADATAQEAVWRAVEDAALGFSVLTSATLSFDAQATAQAIETVAPIPNAAPAPVFADSSVRVDAAEVGEWAARPETAGGDIAPNVIEGRPTFPTIIPVDWVVETVGGIPGIPVASSPAASVPAMAPSAVGSISAKAAVSGGIPLAPNVGEAHTLDVTLGPGGETIDLGQADTLWSIVVAGHGALTLRNARAADSIEVASGARAALTLVYDKPASGDTVSLALDGATQVSLTSVLQPDPSAPPAPDGTTQVSVTPSVPLDPPKPPALHLVVDSQGAAPNDLNIVDPTSGSSASININVTGTQNLTLNESADSFADSNLDASTLLGSLTVALDLSNGDLNATHLIFGSGNFVATPEDNIALENLPNDARIDLGIDLNIVILAGRDDLTSSSGPMALTIDLGSLGPVPSPVAISEIEAAGVADLFVNSPGGANSVQTIEDAALAKLVLSGPGSVEIGSLTGIAAGDNQSVLIDASNLTGSLTLDASAIADTAAGGRQVSFIFGSGPSIVSDMNATEPLNVAIGAGQALVNIAGGATRVAISGLEATDHVNVGAPTNTDTFINGLNMLLPYQSAIDASGSLVTAATIAASHVNSTGQHQAMLFSYKGDTYVFVNAVGNHIFSPSLDAIVRLTGVSPATDLSGVFHSA